MSMSLRPYRELEDEPDYPIGFWEWLMFDAGCGQVIGVRWHETEANKFYYEKDEKGLCPMYNDGYHVTKKQAENMARLAIEAIPKFPDREQQLKRFALFCEMSGGFEIH